ncbi:unnamed protein product, partial [Rotaria socialis]
RIACKPWSVDAVPMTRKPHALAICTAAMPTCSEKIGIAS